MHIRALHAAMCLADFHNYQSCQIRIFTIIEAGRAKLQIKQILGRTQDRNRTDILGKISQPYEVGKLLFCLLYR